MCILVSQGADLALTKTLVKANLVFVIKKRSLLLPTHCGGLLFNESLRTAARIIIIIF